ncbi:S1 family peptidase [Paraglaciecola polaris]|uniref:Serine protease n=1 Tax=Paraglaciecola polaris LMG 21857 TaxID=1129793 RepID=K6ZDV0_9ALTE|nr:serine protease [Paraglaciecola polaris]GAC34256.1 serine protease [Paraglaciecola polaris LMG 21857]|tara:strand:+ start:17373 stop:18155 length:783 start_codon:yes stop_codon:yes gene_type:complete
MISKDYIYKIICVVFSCLVFSVTANATGKTKLVKKMKPSVVGVGLYDAMSFSTHQLRGSGFVFGDGTLIATNYHVVSEPLDPQIVQYHIVFSGTGRQPKIHKAEIVARDPVHDLAILKIHDKLPPLTLGSDNYADDGQDILMTGFPIGSILGLYPATHKGMIAALTPDVIPSVNSSQLTMTMRNRLENPFMIYQLDMTAYPGNSGSAIYDADTGMVIGILNKVFIKETKEAVLEKPSGISYAIPVRYLRALAKNKNLTVN